MFTEKIVVLGDVHLGKSSKLGKDVPGSPLNSRIEDQLHLLHWVSDQAKEQEASIVITGDIFQDPKPHPTIIALFIKWLQVCTSEGIGVFIIAGNHDLLRTDQTYYSPLDIISEAKISDVKVIMHPTKEIVGNISLALFPFRDRSSLSANTLDEALEIIKKDIDSLSGESYSVAIGHLALKGSMYIGDEVQNITNELLVPPEFFDSYDVTIMGHVHKFQHISDKTLHIGSMDISDFGETDQEKKIIILDGKGYTTKTIPTRKLSPIKISIPSGTEDSTKFVLDILSKQKVKNSIARIEIEMEDSDTLAVDSKKVQEFLVKSGVHNVSGITQVKKKSVATKASQQLTSDITVEKAIRVFFEEKYPDDVDRQSSCITLANEILIEESSK
jgi:DNA repair exonuclease SbcCD nuclease subunit